MNQTLTTPATARAKAGTQAGTKARKPSRLSPRVRKTVLTCHVIVAVGWAGVEVAQLILGLVGLFTGNPEVMRATHIVMELLGIELIAVAAWASLLTGLLLALATPWGLIKHYWIAAKLTINIALMLAGHFFFQHWLRSQAEPQAHLPVTEVPSVSFQLVTGIAIALVLLVTATAISITKPWGRTRFARR